MNELSSHTLHVVAKELAVTLNDARAALEAYAERPDQRAQLEKCADLLHSAHGALRLVEVYGAALLAEEMEHVTRYLLTAGNDPKRQLDGLDALMRAMVQLPTYLERVLSGGRDLALVLLPLLNDLRSVRGSPLLSEGTLLLLNLKSDAPAQPHAQRQGEALMVTQWARRLRPQFQLALLGYIRGERSVQNLEVLSRVSEKLEQVATSQPVFQLWWVVGAILEALRTNGLEGSATLKRLLGQADRQIKLLYELGEARYGEDPPIDLLNNLLYYVARASTNGGRISAVRASFKLAELLPVDDSIEQERESLSAPSVKLMRTVAAAIKEDLSKVKDVLDIFVRRGGGASDELAPQLELLKKISDTLGVLGLGELRQRVQQEIGELADIVTEGKVPPEESLVRVAGVLLSVEDSLDDQLVRLILPTGGDHGAAADSSGCAGHRVPPGQRGGAAGVHRQPGAHQGGGHAGGRQADRFCAAGPRQRAPAAARHHRRPADAGQDPRGRPDGGHRQRGAPTGRAGRHRARSAAPGAHRRCHRQHRVLHGDAAERALRSLVHAGQRRDQPARTARPGVARAEHRASQRRGGRADGQAGYAGRRNLALDRARRVHAQTSPLIGLPEPGAGRSAVHRAVHRGSQGRDRLDPDRLPAVGPESDGPGIAVRHAPQLPHAQGQRAHGRRAHLAEFAWSVENLLNRIIDKTLTRTPGMMGLLRSSVAALGPLVEQLRAAARHGAGRAADGARLCARRRPRRRLDHGRGQRGAPVATDVHRATESWSQQPAARPSDYG